jgi:hypothetical protein
MKLSTEIIKKWKEANKPDFNWKVPSKSEKEKWHAVTYSEKNGWECDCMDFQMHGKKRECKHILLTKMKYNG